MPVSSPAATTHAPAPPAAPAPYFQALDVVRFAAAALLLTYHSFDQWLHAPAVAALAFDGWQGQPAWWAGKLKLLVGNFTFGVDIFFLLSGFLITYLLLVERQRYGRIAIKSFYLRRVLRIWPLYYLSVALGPVLTHTVKEPAIRLLPNLFFWGNFDLARHGWGSTAVNHLWSICIEEHFYLFWPLLVSVVPLRRLPTAFAGMMLVSFLVRLYYFYFVPDSYMSLLLNTWCRWDALALGALLAYAHFRGHRLPLVSAPVRWMLYGAALLVFANDSYGNWDNVFLLSFKKIFFLGVVAFALGNVLFNPASSVQWRKPTIFHYFGKISYGIYMYHGVVILVLCQQGDFFKTPFFILWVLAATLAVSALSYELLEKPILRLKKYADAFGERRPLPASA